MQRWSVTPGPKSTNTKTLAKPALLSCTISRSPRMTPKAARIALVKGTIPVPGRGRRAGWVCPNMTVLHVNGAAR